MQNHKTQQFAKFFLKDLKPKKSDFAENKPVVEKYSVSSSN